MARHRTMGKTRLQRMYLHIVEGEVDRGRPLKVAKRIAAATVNRFRGKQARRRKGPRLVTRGGSRRQWYPGKKLRREKFVCLKHRRRFKTKAGLSRHYGSKVHRRAA